MLAEKKSLRRFLIVYIVSTVILMGIGEWIYYNSRKHFIIDSQVSELSSKLKLFLTENRGMLKKLRYEGYFPYENIDIAVYKNGRFLFGGFKTVLSHKEFWNDAKYVYYQYTMPKRWGRVDIIIREKIDNLKIKSLKKELVIFNIFAFLFILAVSFLLGKIFLKPLKNSVDSLENFIRDSTHEMNTPISVILTNVEMLKMKGVESKELQRIEFSAKRLEKIFKDLTFLRLNHRQKREIKKINLKELIKNRIEIFNTVLENKKIGLEKSCEDFYVNVDREDMVRLIDNLISNAVKYSPQKETIRLSLKNGTFCVSNKGEIKDLHKITKKFYRENQNEGGFGLGLYIVKKICDYYGFKFMIKNDKNNVIVNIEFV